MFSIIIPTLNEERYLPLLLESIKKQDFNNYEIIVADAGSEDKTVEIAKNYGCKIVKGGLPAKGRNEGAKVARGDTILFLDADVILPENFFENTLKEFEKRNLDIASFSLEPQSKSNFPKFLFNIFYNRPIKFLEKSLLHASQAILVKKILHQKIGGFDEEIKLAEDHYYIREAAKIGKFGIIKSSRVLISTRRFEKDGWLKTYLKYLLAELHLIFLGPIKSDIFRYRFGYPSEAKAKRTSFSS